MQKLIPILFLFCLFSANSLPNERLFYWTEPENIQLLNTQSNDFAPIWNRYDSLFYFNSEISGFSEFYFADYSFGRFGKSNWVKGELNKKNSNQSYITFVTEDRALLSAYRKSKDGKSYINVFQSGRKRDVWLPPIPVDSLLSNNFCGHTTISEDGSAIFFVTTFGSLYGDTDIWMAQDLGNNVWGNAISINELNTPGNEITPFLASSDTLYFASDGHDGPGGYDIFYSVYSNGKWQRPYPINELNTVDNESDFTIMPDGNAVFASDRPNGIGKLDLYLTRKSNEEIREIKPKEVELSFSSDTELIEVKADLQNTKHQLIPYIFLGEEFSNYSLKKDLYKVNNSIDSIQKYTLSYISQKMKSFPDAVLFIRAEVNGKTLDKDKFSEILNAFENVYDIDTSRVILKSVSTSDDPNNRDHLIFDTNEPNLFNTIDVDSGRMELDPAFIEVSLDSRPRELINNWECRLIIDDAADTVVAKGNILPYKMSLDLRNYAADLYYNDSLTLKFTAWTRDLEISKTMSISLSRSAQKAKKLEKIGKKRVIRYEITALKPEHLSLQSYALLLKEVSLNIGLGKKIVIEYSGEIVNSESIARKLKDLIELGSGKRVEIRKTIKKESDGFRSKYSNYIFDVIIYID
jgi:hypothetical protein